MKKLYLSISEIVYSTPSPSSISFLWNFGSILGVVLSVQIVSGLMIALHYNSSVELAFDSVISLEEEVNNGWILRSIHANGASFFFIFLYLHIGRGVFFRSMKLKSTWFIGMTIFVMTMTAAFLGYVLPWGQMSLWGATVITNLLSALPFLGSDLVVWVWGGFSVSGPTLERFFALHFIIPFAILPLVGSHVIMLHSTGSSNPLGLSLHSDKVFFQPFFIVKDILGIIMMVILFLLLSLLSGDLFMDPDNFTKANPLVTPPHIQPEWYFLFAYAILRSIPNKLGGVIALAMSIALVFLLPLSGGESHFFWKVKSSIFFSSFFLLTFLGGQVVEYPFEGMGQALSILYFGILFLLLLN